MPSAARAKAPSRPQAAPIPSARGTDPTGNRERGTENGIVLLALRAEPISTSLFDGPFPSRLVICPPGQHSTRARGPVIVDAGTFAGLAERQNAIGLGMRLALDAEHSTLPGHPAYLAAKEPRPVLAWATLSGSPEEGLLFDQIEPTPLGLEAWANRQFQDVSPTIYRDKSGRVIAVHSAALCRHGELDGLTIEAAAAPAGLAAQFAALSATLEIELETDPSTTLPMNPTLLKALSAILVTAGIDPLPDNPDEPALEAALTALGGKVTEWTKKPEDMSAEGLSLDALSARVVALESRNESLERAEIEREAGAQGKVIPLSPEAFAATPVPVLRELVKNLKAGEAPTIRKVGDPKESTKNPGQPAALSAELTETLNKFGLSEADYRQFGQPETKQAA